MPADIAYIARRETLWLANARHRAGEPELTLDDLGKQVFKPTQPMKIEVEKQAKQFERGPQNEAKYFDSLGIEYTELLLKNLPATRDSMDALYSFIILESWSAFECLAARLGITGVDHSPPVVAARLITAKAKIFDRSEDHIRIE